MSAEEMTDEDHREAVEEARAYLAGVGWSYGGLTKLAKCYLDLLENRTDEPAWLQVGRMKARKEIHEDG